MTSRQLATAISTAGLPPPHRAEAVRSLVWESVVKVEIDHHEPPERIAVDLRLGSLGSLGVCAVRATSTTVRRTARLARRDDDPPIFLGLQMSGTSMVVQDGREAVLHPGDFALYDTAGAYSLLFGGGMDAVFFRIPRATLGLTARQLHDVTAVALGSASAVAELTSAYLTRLAVTEALPYGRHGVLVAEPTIDLVCASVAAHLDDPDLRGAAAASTLPFQIMSFLRAHLADPELSPATVAAAHHISVRYLYQILARCGVRFGEWVRQARLEGARKDLARPAYRSLTIASVGRRWGFTDSSHFSKAFKQEYGMSPRAWREATFSLSVAQPPPNRPEC
ncbi:helix-turn-helix domain-containing protein [Phytohabitans sp. ZYX-F-186]|uniref:Helix-turn-helix domain-containing protein n=1 Tax=Phytohabitans maris TaxID=3071409 RepID=A0ABU0ZGB6_9ACTN|nr:helix-turn-helix domain-containing protein [Phytohabitans sp. ZYX-F-186]MDQ7906103.1 helix-turn-helix domain-containing protein [Phytohabitans sp. ZYX-F-186]